MSILRRDLRSSARPWIRAAPGGSSSAKRGRNLYRSGPREYRRGRRMAYVEVVSLMQQQAVAFEIPLTELSLDGIDPERDLM